MTRQILAGRVAHLGTTVFSEFSALALKHGAMNLGQGFPDFDGPEAVKAKARTMYEGYLKEIDGLLDGLGPADRDSLYAALGSLKLALGTAARKESM